MQAVQTWSAKAERAAQYAAEAELYYNPTLLQARLSQLPGDVVVASAFMSYAGPFPSEYRDELVKDTWLTQVWAYKC